MNSFFTRREWIFKAVFIYTLAIVSIAMWVLLQGYPAFGAPLLCVHTFIVFAALLIKPIKYLITKKTGNWNKPQITYPE